MDACTYERCFYPKSDVGTLESSALVLVEVCDLDLDVGIGADFIGLFAQALHRLDVQTIVKIVGLLSFLADDVDLGRFLLTKHWQVFTLLERLHHLLQFLKAPKLKVLSLLRVRCDQELQKLSRVNASLQYFQPKELLFGLNISHLMS